MQILHCFIYSRLICYIRTFLVQCFGCIESSGKLPSRIIYILSNARTYGILFCLGNNDIEFSEICCQGAQLLGSNSTFHNHKRTTRICGSRRVVPNTNLAIYVIEVSLVKAIDAELIAISANGVVFKNECSSSFRVSTDFVICTRAGECFSSTSRHVVYLKSVLNIWVFDEAEETIAVCGFASTILSYIINLIKLGILLRTAIDY